MEWKNKRYQFRITNNDKDIFDFINHSKETDSETIRKLLKFAVSEIVKEKETRKEKQLLQEIMGELQLFRNEQINNHKEIIEKIKSGFVINQNTGEKEQDKESKSVDNSIDSMLDSFGIE